MPAPVVTRPAPKPRPTADAAAAILAAAVPADDTPARAYLASRGTWPPAGSGPDLPAVVRWLPPSTWAHLPTWTDGGRERRLSPPRDGVTRLLLGAAPVRLRCRCAALLAPTVARLAAAGITIGPHTATPEWYGESLNLAAALDVPWEPPVTAPRDGP